VHVERRTSLFVDDVLLARARDVLGTRGTKATVDAALREVIRADRRRRLVERFRTGDGLDFDAMRVAREQWTRR
jgi:Arc/MetJ family transcription regulator